MQFSLFEPVEVASRPVTRPDEVPDASLIVLSSSSGGNCSALILGGASPRIILIDLGLSPRRTGALLAAAGLDQLPVAAVIITHLDTDHLSPSWSALKRGSTPLPSDVPLYIHKRHIGRAQREGTLFGRTYAYDDGFEPAPGVTVRSHLVAHDSLGCASLRVEVGDRRLGWATDVGCPTESLARHLAGVDVLAIESNYCPVMEHESERPEFLKRRVMGGAGHLSNQQCGDLARRVAPRSHVVLLHLSRQCNTPELAAAEHAGAPYTLIVSRHDGPTPRIPLGQPTYR